MSEKETIFVDGLMFDYPRNEAPAFVKGHLIINPDRFAKWAAEQKEYQSEKGWLRIDMMKSKKGSLYLKLDTWKPEKQESPKEDPRDNPEPEEDGIPF